MANCNELITNRENIVKIIHILRAVARTLIGGVGCIFIYSGSARLVSFQIKLISKEVSRAEPEYMNIPPPPQLAFWRRPCTFSNHIMSSPLNDDCHYHATVCIISCDVHVTCKSPVST